MTQTPDELTLLFTELGESTPEIDRVIEHPGEPRWAIGLNDDLLVTVDLVEDQSALILCADVGRPQEQHRLRVYEAMLMYSSLRQSNGGFTMALAQADGECQILSDIAARDVDVHRLRTGILDLASKARLWREVVALGADPTRASPGAHQILGATVWG